MSAALHVIVGAAVGCLIGWLLAKYGFPVWPWRHRDYMRGIVILVIYCSMIAVLFLAYLLGLIQ